jgi:hypothetical protein
MLMLKSAKELAIFCYNENMNCPICKKPMKKIAWRITTNSQEGKELKEYDKTTYQCVADDAWVETELPIAE